MSVLNVWGMKTQGRQPGCPGSHSYYGQQNQEVWLQKYMLLTISHSSDEWGMFARFLLNKVMGRGPQEGQSWVDMLALYIQNTEEPQFLSPSSWTFIQVPTVPQRQRYGETKS